MNKRTFIKNSALMSSAILLSNQVEAINNIANQIPTPYFTLPVLPYAYDALEPHFDKTTMTIHHTKHHLAYVENLNKAVNNTDAAKLPIDSICKTISKYPIAVRNNGGGHYNHSFFWNILAPNAGGKPSGTLAAAIDKKFGAFDTFKEEFTKAAMSRFGSGWAWLIVNENKELQICSSPNQDNPLMDIAEVKGNPIVGLDVWEHAYYLKYQNKRADYVAAFWNVLNWKAIEAKFDLFTK